MENPDLIQHTQKWVEQFVVRLNICPFARPVIDQNTLTYAISNADAESVLTTLLSECQKMDQHTGQETTLIIFDRIISFDQYLDILDMANILLEEREYDGTYQLASFHPDYQFEGESPDAASNYTNRSPYPMLHIIREASIEAAIDNLKDPAQIPERNIELCEQMGKEALEKQLKQYKS